MTPLTELDRRVARAMKEAELQQYVNDTLDTLGWRWMHCRPARTALSWRTAISGHKGFPDIVAVRGRRLLFAELKAESEQPAADQVVWLTQLEECALVTPIYGGPRDGLMGRFPEVYIWRPSDWVSGRIVETLQ